MKVCPKCNCNCEDDVDFCPLCGFKFTEENPHCISIGDSNAISGGVYVDMQGDSKSSIPNFSLGDANAISGGVHLNVHKTENHNIESLNVNTTNIDKQTIDSHDDNSVTNIDNSIHIEAAKTAEQLTFEARKSFIARVSQLLQDGVFDISTKDELVKARIQYNIPEQEAEEIIELYRKNTTLSTTKGDDIAVDSVKRAIESCNVDLLKISYPKLKELSNKTTNASVQYYTHLVAMSNNPQNCANACAFSKTENYWQLFWAYVASVRVGNVNQARLFAQIGAFDGYPGGNIKLLTAIELLYAYKKNQSQVAFFNELVQNLQDAQTLGISEELNPVWCAVEALKSDSPEPSDYIQFYCRYTFPELLSPPSNPTMSTNTTLPPIPETKVQQPERKKMVGADAANVKLQQMQGFNPLEGFQNANGFGMQSGIIGINNTLNTSGIVGIQGGKNTPPPIPKTNTNEKE